MSILINDENISLSTWREIIDNNTSSHNNSLYLDYHDNILLTSYSSINKYRFFTTSSTHLLPQTRRMENIFSNFYDIFPTKYEYTTLYPLPNFVRIFTRDYSIVENSEIIDVLYEVEIRDNKLVLIFDENGASRRIEFYITRGLESIFGFINDRIKVNDIIVGDTLEFIISFIDNIIRLNLFTNEYLDHLSRIKFNYPRVFALFSYVFESVAINSNTNLIGPISYSGHVSRKYDKRVMIFGDKHVHSPICIDDTLNKIRIDDYLAYLLLKHSSKSIDLFVEDLFPENRERDDYPPLWLFYVMKKFKNCRQVDKIACEYDNLRYHYTNVRFKSILFGYVLSYYARDEEKIINFLDLEFPLTDDTIYQVIKDTKIDKQLNEVKDEEFVGMFLEFFERRIKEYNYGKITERKIMLLCATFMDMYLIARMFRSFYDYDNSRNCVVFAGENHAQTYRDFLESVGFDKVFERRSDIEETSMQCINLSGVIDIFE